MTTDASVGTHLTQLLVSVPTYVYIHPNTNIQFPTVCTYINWDENAVLFLTLTLSHIMLADIAGRKYGVWGCIFIE